MSCGRNLINATQLQRIVDAFATAASVRTTTTAVSAVARPKRKLPDPVTDNDGGAVLMLTEHVDMAVVEYLAAHLDLIKSVNDRAKFLTYVGWARQSAGRVPVSYQQSGLVSGRGRYNAKHASSMQGLCRPLSNALALRYYVQLDMKNCHLVLMRGLARRLQIPAPGLERYVVERDAVLAEILPNDPVAAKKLMLLCAYDGGIAKRCRELRLRGVPAIVRSYANDCRRIEARVVPEHPEIVQRLVDNGEDPQQKRFGAQVLSHVLQQLESDALMAAVAFMRSRDWEIGALKHDGFLVHRNADGLGPDAATIRALEQHVSASCDAHDVVYVQKPLDDEIIELPSELLQ